MRLESVEQERLNEPHRIRYCEEVMSGLSAWINVFRDLNKISTDPEQRQENRLVEEAIHERLGQQSNDGILALYETVTGESLPAIPSSSNRIPQKQSNESARRSATRLPSANPENDGRMHWFNR